MASIDRQEAGTPPDLFAQLHSEYRFTIDVCASAINHKLPCYLTKEDDALDADWSGERAWCNNPFDDIAPWLAHALEPELAVFLEPVRTDRWWWMRWRPLAEVHWFVGEKPDRRMQFVAPPGVKYSSNPFCLCLLCFGDGFEPGRERWRSSSTGRLLVPEDMPSC